MTYAKKSNSRKRPFRPYRRRRYARHRKNTTNTKSKINYNVGQVVKTNHRKKIMVRAFPTLFPDRVILKFQYKDVIQISQATPGINANYIFRLNSLYDPDYTSAGVQCMGYDQWCTLYERYRVTGMAYDLNCYTANTVPSQLCVIPTTANTLISTSIQDVSMQPGASKIITITPDNSQARLKGYITPATVFGITKSQYNTDVLYNAGISANPTTVSYLQINMQPLDETSSCNVTIQVNLTYYAQMYDRVELSPS